MPAFEYTDDEENIGDRICISAADIEECERILLEDLNKDKNHPPYTFEDTGYWWKPVDILLDEDVLAQINNTMNDVRRNIFPFKKGEKLTASYGNKTVPLNDPILQRKIDSKDDGSYC